MEAAYHSLGGDNRTASSSTTPTTTTINNINYNNNRNNNNNNLSFNFTPMDTSDSGSGDNNLIRDGSLGGFSMWASSSNFFNTNSPVVSKWTPPGSPNRTKLKSEYQVRRRF